MSQTFTDFELLLVDDCSPDESGKICDAFAKMDKRIKVVHLEKNSGVAVARNTVMIPACGEYLCFFLNGLEDIPDVSYSKLFTHRDFTMVYYQENLLEQIVAHGTELCVEDD